MSSLTQLKQPSRTPLTTLDFQQPQPYLLDDNERSCHESENLPVSAWSLSIWKRLLDIIIAIAVLTGFALPSLVIVLCIRLSSRGPALFIQKRVGRLGKPFDIYKFRSMTISDERGPTLTRDGDSRVTPIGRWLRKLKLDEIPQFYNVLRGDMSLIGPRPKLSQYTESLNMPYRPGITGAATLAFRNEEEILRAVAPSNLDTFYERRIKPMKARIDSDYMSCATLWTDSKLVALTFVACFMPSRVPTALQTNAGESAEVSAHDASNVVRMPTAVREIAGDVETAT